MGRWFEVQHCWPHLRWTSLFFFRFDIFDSLLRASLLTWHQHTRTSWPATDCLECDRGSALEDVCLILRIRTWYEFGAVSLYVCKLSRICKGIRQVKLDGGCYLYQRNRQLCIFACKGLHAKLVMTRTGQQDWNWLLWGSAWWEIPSMWHVVSEVQATAVKGNTNHPQNVYLWDILRFCPFQTYQHSWDGLKGRKLLGRTRSSCLQVERVMASGSFLGIWICMSSFSFPCFCCSQIYEVFTEECA